MRLPKQMHGDWLCLAGTLWVGLQRCRIANDHDLMPVDG